MAREDVRDARRDVVEASLELGERQVFFFQGMELVTDLGEDLVAFGVEVDGAACAEHELVRLGNRDARRAVVVDGDRDVLRGDN